MKTKSTFSRQNFYKCAVALSAGFLFALLFKILLKIISVVFLVMMGALVLGVISSWERNKYSK